MTILGILSGSANLIRTQVMSGGFTMVCHIVAIITVWHFRKVIIAAADEWITQLALKMGSNSMINIDAKHRSALEYEKNKAIDDSRHTGAVGVAKGAAHAAGRVGKSLLVGGAEIAANAATDGAFSAVELGLKGAKAEKYAHMVEGAKKGIHAYKNKNGIVNPFDKNGSGMKGMMSDATRRGLGDVQQGMNQSMSDSELTRKQYEQGLSHNEKNKGKAGLNLKRAMFNKANMGEGTFETNPDGSLVLDKNGAPVLSKPVGTVGDNLMRHLGKNMLENNSPEARELQNAAAASDKSAQLQEEITKNDATADDLRNQLQNLPEDSQSGQEIQRALDIVEKDNVSLSKQLGKELSNAGIESNVGELNKTKGDELETLADVNQSETRANIDAINDASDQGIALGASQARHDGNMQTADLVNNLSKVDDQQALQQQATSAMNDTQAQMVGAKQTADEAQRNFVASQTEQATARQQLDTTAEAVRQLGGAKLADATALNAAAMAVPSVNTGLAAFRDGGVAQLTDDTIGGLAQVPQFSDTISSARVVQASAQKLAQSPDSTVDITPIITSSGVDGGDANWSNMVGQTVDLGNNATMQVKRDASGSIRFDGNQQAITQLSNAGTSGITVGSGDQTIHVSGNPEVITAMGSSDAGDVYYRQAGANAYRAIQSASDHVTQYNDASAGYEGALHNYEQATQSVTANGVTNATAQQQVNTLNQRSSILNNITRTGTVTDNIIDKVKTDAISSSVALDDASEALDRSKATLGRSYVTSTQARDAINAVRNATVTANVQAVRTGGYSISNIGPKIDDARSEIFTKANDLINKSGNIDQVAKNTQYVKSVMADIKTPQLQSELSEMNELR